MNRMNRWIVRSAAALLWATTLVATVEPANAHVVFGNPLFSDSGVIDPITGALGVGTAFSTQQRQVASNAGWAAALNNATWGDSHNARFMYFNLAQPQTIDFTVTATANTNGASLLNPGYSLYSGSVPNVSHDGGNYPGQTPFATWSPFAGGVAGSDPASQKWGEFRSNADVTMRADDSGGNPIVGTMHYLGLSDSNPTGNTISGQYHLGPGLYTLVLGGANSQAAQDLLNAAIATNGAYCSATATTCTPNAEQTAYNNLRLGRNFDIQFNVSPVPIPAAAWLFGSGLTGVAVLMRRRKS
ncbi:MAG: VPLPA-CTERM sorting domain-containing protein [Nitrospira sp.]|nr:VPLPA-CTERM sorting domain-containing protein [Nitrospira sp.]